MLISLFFLKGKYCVIGGKVEPEESYLQAAKRELKEETEFEIENLKPYGVTQLNFMTVIPE